MTKKILILKAVVIPEADTVIVVSLLINTLISISFHLCFISGAFHNFLAYSFTFSADNDYETGSGNRCGYVGDDEDYNDEGSGKDLTRFFYHYLYTYILCCSFRFI